MRKKLPETKPLLFFSILFDKNDAVSCNFGWLPGLGQKMTENL